MRQGTILTVAPTGEPLTLDTAKMQLRIELDDTDQDVHIQSLIAAARAKIENETGMPIMRQTRQTHLFGFPCGPVWLGDGEAVEVTLVRYYDAAGVQQTMPSTDYLVDTISRPAKLWLAPMKAWPSVLSRPGAVQITWTAGWATAAAVPADLAHAMKLLVGHWDMNREAVVTGTISSEIQIAFDALIEPYRVKFVA